jgi:hypothetical protein
MKKIIIALGIMFFSTTMAFAVIGPIPLDESNVLPDWMAYGWVTLTLQPDACPGALDGVEIMVDANEAILIPGTNFGIQAFGFNYNGNINCLKNNIDMPDGWSAKTSKNMSEFGVFVERTIGTGSTRENPLIINVCSSCGDLGEGDLAVKNAQGYAFAAHIADFTYNGQYYPADSAFFATQQTTEIELSSFTAKASNGRVKLEWETESEFENAGFNIYRAEAVNGNYIQINDELIAAKGSPTKGAKYVFTDNIAKNRKIYFYKLEDVDIAGISTFHGPVSAMPRFMLGIFNKK